jgi:hypothetical protein
MTDMTNRDLQDTEIFKVDGENENMETLDQGHADEHPASPESFRAASYFVLFIACGNSYPADRTRIIRLFMAPAIPRQN